MNPDLQIKTAEMRMSETGATRNVDSHKNDYEGFLSPSVIQAFGDYMHSHRMQADGKLRDSDNWQKGLKQDWYMKSMWRHFLDVWSIHRHIARFDETGKEIDKVEALCATLFNVQGMLHEELKRKDAMKLGWSSISGTANMPYDASGTTYGSGVVGVKTKSLSEEMLRCSVDNCIDK